MRLKNKWEMQLRFGKDALNWLALGVESPFHYGVDFVSFTHERLVSRSGLTTDDFTRADGARWAGFKHCFRDSSLYDSALDPVVTAVDAKGVPLAGELPPGMKSEALRLLFQELRTYANVPELYHMEPRFDIESGSFRIDVVRIIKDSSGLRVGALIYRLRLEAVIAPVVIGEKGELTPDARVFILHGGPRRTVFYAAYGAEQEGAPPSVGEQLQLPELEAALATKAPSGYFSVPATSQRPAFFCVYKQGRRDLNGYVVLAMIDERRLFAPWRRDLNTTVGVGVSFVALSALLGFQITRRRRIHGERLQAVEELDRARSRGEEALRQRGELERAVEERTARIAAHNEVLAECIRELDESNAELKSYARMISGDLHQPLRRIADAVSVLERDFARSSDTHARVYIAKMATGTRRMREMVDDLLRLSKVDDVPLTMTRVNLSAMASRVLESLRESQPARRCRFVIEPHCHCEGDYALIRIVMENLIGNAWKYSAKKEETVIEFGMENQGGGSVFFVRDNGAGFDPADAGKLFLTFSRLHSAGEFEGTGIGLATVARIIARHGGRVFAEGRPGVGAVFRFTLSPSASEGGV